MYGNFQRTYRRVVGIITLCLHTPELGIIALRTHTLTHTHYIIQELGDIVDNVVCFI